MKLRTLALTLATLLVSSSTLAAEPASAQTKEPSHRWSWPAFEGQLSWFGPTGLAGLALDVPIRRVLSVQPGLGWTKEGVALSAGARLRTPVPTTWFATPSIGTGLSMRPHTYSDAGPLGSDEYSGSKHWSSAKFLNLDVGIDTRASYGLTFRVFVGARMILNPEGYSCQRGSSYSDQSSCIGDKGEGFEPYFGFAIGYGVPD